MRDLWIIISERLNCNELPCENINAITTTNNNNWISNYMIVILVFSVQLFKSEKWIKEYIRAIITTINMKKYLRSTCAISSLSSKKKKKIVWEKTKSLRFLLLSFIIVIISYFLILVVFNYNTFTNKSEKFCFFFFVLL